MLKLNEPMLKDAISGLAARGAASRSSSVIFSPPPVVMLITASQDCLITGRKRMNTAGSGVGSPVSGSRACRWMMAAPAAAASMEAVAICSGVIGRASDMEGVWIAPVMARPPRRRGGRRRPVRAAILRPGAARGQPAAHPARGLTRRTRWAMLGPPSP